MAEDLVQLLTLSLQNETAGEVSGPLTEALQTPEIFAQLFEIVATETIPIKVRESAAVSIGRAFSLQQQTIDESLIQTIKEQLQTLLFTQIPPDISQKIIGVAVKIFEKVKLAGWPELLGIAITAAAQPEFFNISLLIISSLVKFLPTQIITENLEQLFTLANTATHNTSNSWEQRKAGFNIIATIIKKVQELEILGDIQEYISPILEYPHDATLFNTIPTKQHIEDIWIAIDSLAVSNIIPPTFYEHLLPLIFEISSNAAINADDRSKVLHTIIGILPELSEEQIVSLFDLIFDIGKSSGQDSSVFSIIEVCFEDLDNEMIYTLIKERLEAAIQSQNVELIAFGIKALSIVVTFSPEIAVADIGFINDSLKACLETQNETLAESVCDFLNSLDETFSTATVMCSNMLMAILPFLVSENPSLKRVAFSAVHGLCDMIDCEIEGFFETAWQLKEQIAAEDLESYTSILGASIRYADLGDEELDALMEYINELFSSEEDIDITVAALNLVSAILQYDDSQAEDLLPPSFELALQALSSTNRQTQTSVIDFIGEIYPFSFQLFPYS